MINYSASLVTIATTNFDNLWKFYAHLLTQQPQPFRPNVYAGFHLPGITLGIFHPKDHNSFIPGQGAISLCLEVNDLELAIDHAHQPNCLPPSAIITASHGREAYVYDPDGNRIILHQGEIAPK
jgi:predicted enzyme related to lactoylglutathione lyase